MRSFGKAAGVVRISRPSARTFLFGGVGCPSGFSTIVARTEKGLDLLKKAEGARYLELRELKQDEEGYQKILAMAQTKRLRKAIQNN